VFFPNYVELEATAGRTNKILKVRKNKSTYRGGGISGPH
jgi:predicted outer membrane repeat protein